MPSSRRSLVVLCLLAELANAADYATTALGHAAYGFGEANPLLIPRTLLPASFFAALTIGKSVIAVVLGGVLWIGLHARSSWGVRLPTLVTTVFLVAIVAYGYATTHAVRGLWTMWLIQHGHP